jgi:hypothetical protein
VVWLDQLVRIRHLTDSDNLADGRGIPDALHDLLAIRSIEIDSYNISTVLGQPRLELFPRGCLTLHVEVAAALEQLAQRVSGAEL